MELIVNYINNNVSSNVIKPGYMLLITLHINICTFHLSASVSPSQRNLILASVANK